MRLSFILLLLLTGCGYKANLYLPPPIQPQLEQPPVQSPEATPSDTSDAAKPAEKAP